MPNSSSVKRAFLETRHRRVDDGTARTGHPVLLLPETPRSSAEYPDVPGIPGGMVRVVGQMPEAGAAAGVGLLRGDAE
jgi:hypothetical protein